MAARRLGSACSRARRRRGTASQSRLTSSSAATRQQGMKAFRRLRWLANAICIGGIRRCALGSCCWPLFRNRPECSTPRPRPQRNIELLGPHLSRLSRRPPKLATTLLGHAAKGLYGMGSMASSPCTSPATVPLVVTGARSHAFRHAGYSGQPPSLIMQVAFALPSHCCSSAPGTWHGEISGPGFEPDRLRG